MRYEIMIAGETVRVVPFLVVMAIVVLALLAIATATANAQTYNHEYLFVPASGQDQIAIIDENTDTVLMYLKVGEQPEGVALSPAGTYLYVTTHNGIEVYDTLNFKLRYTVPLHGYYPYGIAIDSSGVTAYVAAVGRVGWGTNDSILYIDLPTGEITTVVSLGTPTSVIPVDVRVWENTLLVNGIISDKLYKIMIGTAEIVSTISLSDSPEGYSWTDSPQTYVCLPNNNSVDIYSTLAFSLTRSYAVTNPYAIATGVFNTSEIYIVNNSKITTISSNSNAPINIFSVVSVGSAHVPDGILASTTLPKVYVEIDNGTVASYNTANRTVTGYFFVGNDAASYGMMATGIINNVPGGQLVQIKVQDETGIWIGDNLDVTAYFNDQLMYSEITDSSGIVSFYLSSAATYTFVVNGSGINTVQIVTINPAQTFYSIKIPYDQIIGFSDIAKQFLNQSQAANVEYRVDNSLNISDNVAVFNCSYLDFNLLTTWVTFSLYMNNTTGPGAAMLIGQQSIGFPFAFANFTVENGAGHDYYVLFDASQSGGAANLTYYVPISVAGPHVWSGILPLGWCWWFAFVPVFIIYGAGVATKKGLIALVGVAWVFIATVFGWWEITPIPGLLFPDAMMYGVVGLSFLLAMIMMVQEAEKYK